MLGELLSKLGGRVAASRGATSVVARDILNQAAQKGTNVLRGGLREIFNPTGTWTSTVAKETFRPTIGNRIVSTGVKEMTRTHAMTGIVGAGLKHVAPRLAAASAIDAYLDTPQGQELSGAARMGIGAVGMGLRIGAARHAVRGIAGTGLSMLGRATGNASRFGGAYSWVHSKTGNMFQRGSVTNFMLKGAIGGAAFVPRQAARMVVGLPHAAVASVKGASRLWGSTGEMWSQGLSGMSSWASKHRVTKPLAPIFGGGSRAAGWAGKAGGWAGRSEFGQIMTPKFSNSGKLNAAFAKMGIINKDHHAPIMSGFITMGMGAQFAYGMARRDSTPYNMRGLDPLSNSGIRPSYYGAGVHAMRRGAARNYGPSLTLQLHRGHSRVMPY